MEISERSSLFYQGAIPANGTLSSEIDLAGADVAGLIYSGATNGTITFQVSHKADADGGAYRDLNAANGAAVAYGASGAAGAVDATVLNALRGYRFIKIKMSITQAGIVQFYLPAKA